MSEQNKALMRRWFEEVWNRGQADAIEEMFASDGVAYGLTDERQNFMRGPADYKIFYHQYREAFPDIHITIEDMIAEGDKVATRCLVKGRPTGNSLGVTATNAPISFEGVAITRIKDGKIVEAWNYFDLATMHRQLGSTNR